MIKNFKDWEETLKTPIVISSFNPDEDFKRQIYERIHALFKHYKIESRDNYAWFALAMSMAVDFLPCFKLKSVFDDRYEMSEDAIIFYAEMRKIMKEKNVSILKAAEEYSNKQGTVLNTETLKSNYCDIQKENHLIAGMRKMIEEDLEKIDISDKEDLIQQCLDDYIFDLAENLKELKNCKNKQEKEDYLNKMQRVLFRIEPVSEAVEK